MEYLQLASSGLKISRIGFGCAAISGYDYGKVDDRESIDAIRKAWEAGVNLFDTSDVYGFGHVEEILAKALGNDRHEAIITTKFGINWDQSGKTFKDCSVKRMTWALEDSLRRLQVDCIPIYMVHWHDGVTPLPEIMEALGECQKQGKIRYLGCSNFTAKMVWEASETHKIDFVQLPYNLVRREYEGQLIESVEQLSMTTMVYDVLARGLLSGKYNKRVQFGENDTRARDQYFSGAYFNSNLQMVKRLETIGRRHHKTPAQVAIRWALERPYIRCVLIGSKRSSQVAENTDVFGWRLTLEDQAELEQ
jgi:aryl-alcohol dehydrogenase-like predicted oxidoreductase